MSWSDLSPALPVPTLLLLAEGLAAIRARFASDFTGLPLADGLEGALAGGAVALRAADAAWAAEVGEVAAAQAAVDGARAAVRARYGAVRARLRLAERRLPGGAAFAPSGRVLPPLDALGEQGWAAAAGRLAAQVRAHGAALGPVGLGAADADALEADAAALDAARGALRDERMDQGAASAARDAARAALVETLRLGVDVGRAALGAEGLGALEALRANVLPARDGEGAE